MRLLTFGHKVSIFGNKKRDASMPRRRNQVERSREVVMKVQILGSGCAKCKLLEQHAREAVAELGIQAEIEKVSDIARIVEMGVMTTPALAIDGVVKSAGRVLTKEQAASYLR